MTPDWVSSQRVQALGHNFAVRSPDRRIIETVDWAYQSLLVGGHPASWYSVAPIERGLWRLTWQSELVVEGVSAGKAFSWLQWDANRRAHASVSDLALHAAAAQHREGAVILLGDSGAGKSTLVARLVLAGLRYLTDEAVVLPSDAALIEPYPKPLALSSEAIKLLGVGALPSEPLRGDDDDKISVPPNALRPNCVGDTCAPYAVVFLSREVTSRTVFEPVGPGKAILALGQFTLNPPLDRPGLEALAALVRNVPAYRLSASDTLAASNIVLELLR